MSGLSRLSDSAEELIGRFGKLSDILQFFAGRTSPEQDWIEGEFAPKSDGKLPPGPSKTPATDGGSIVGPVARAASTSVQAAALEGEVVEGAAAATSVAIEGELLPAAGAAATSLAGVAAVAIPLTIALTAIIGAVYAFRLGLTTALNDIKNLEGFSPELSAENARGEIRQTLAEFRRAERLGPQLAELSNITSRGQEALYELGTEAMAVFLQLLDLLKPLIEAGITSAQITSALIPVIKEDLDVVATFCGGNIANLPREFAEAVVANKQATERIVKALKKKPDEDGINDPFIDQLWAGLWNLAQNKNQRRNPAPPAPAGGMP